MQWCSPWTTAARRSIPIPAALEDSLALYRHLLERYAPASGPHRDSSGANLAIGTALTLRDAGEVLPSSLGLICPFLDLADRAGESRATLCSPARG